MPKVVFSNEFEGRKHYHFFCPACQNPHSFSVPSWTFNDDFEKPTIGGSIGVYKKDLSAFECHSFVSDGKITFCDDSTGHNVRGTVDLPEVPDIYLNAD